MNDHTGRAFGWLTVLSYAGRGPSGNHKRTWFCRCSCGKLSVIREDNLLSGNSQSCGSCRRGPGGVRRHGLCNHPLYNLWEGIKHRCYYSRSKNYVNYGGRGITMHDAWINDPQAFITWVERYLGPRPKGYQLDRIDNDGDYRPGNLRWATCSENNFNRRSIPKLQERIRELETRLSQYEVG